MRKLVILRGAMGVGKSTFIKERNLERFTLSSDAIRLMLNAPELTIDYSLKIPQYNNKKVWELLYYFLEERMKKSEFTIIDAVHASKEDLTSYKKLAKKYRYRLYIIDFTNIEQEEVYKRNINRELYKIVPTSSIDRAYKKFKIDTIPRQFKIVAPDAYDSILTITSSDFDHFKNIHIFGDIHGCLEPLKEYFNQNKIQEDDAYIFVGDYFDRGIENYQTYEFINELMNRNNMFFLIGNHEDKLYKYACDDQFKMDYDIKNTIREFEDNNISKSMIRGFISKLRQLEYFKFRNKTYIVTHGGLPYFPNEPLDYYSSNLFIYGVDKFDTNIDLLYDNYMKKSDNKIYQIHGHRNYFNIELDKYEYSYNLEGDIENGGNLIVLNLCDDGTTNYTTIKNNVYDKDLMEKCNVYNLIDSFRSNKYIYEKELGNNISSFNFTKEAFYNRVWNDFTNKARGLFIDKKENKIVARSYNKFFNIDERYETSIDSLKENLVFPVNFYLKYNGFLGILSLYDNELFFATKSTNTGTYVEYFKNIFYKSFSDEQIAAIKDKIRNDDVTFVFEVIDHIDDPHIIKYKNDSLILLDIIKNKTEFSKLGYSELADFGRDNKIEIKELIYQSKDIAEFEDIYSSISYDDYKLNDEYIEGFVIEDANNFMIKFKSKYYKEWKNLRSIMEKAISSNNFKIKNADSLEGKFILYLKNKYEDKNQDIKNLSVISERDEFLKESNDILL